LIYGVNPKQGKPLSHRNEPNEKEANLV